MALPPTIPTSFVPHSAASPQRFRTDLTGAFGFFAYALLAFAFILALGVFFYGRILAADKVAKDKALEAEISKIDAKTVDSFLRLRDRLSSGETLLNNHVAYSGFFATLEKILPTTVRFDSLDLTFDAAGVAKLDGKGLAKSFNALAAASSAFAEDGRIKDAIFSSINVNKDKSVSFTLSASLDQNIIVFTP
jgi:hypothetical protein